MICHIPLTEVSYGDSAEGNPIVQISIEQLNEDEKWLKLNMSRTCWFGTGVAHPAFVIR